MIITCCMHLDLNAELLILKKDKTTGFLTTLTSQESANYGEVICKILLKYQWPMSIASDLTSQEINSLLISGTDCAEEDFIEKKLRESIADIDLVVVFIPTSMYEIFEMIQFFKAHVLEENKNTFMSAALIFDKQKKDNKSAFDDKVVALLNMNDGLTAEKVHKKIFEAYLLENDLFYNIKHNDLIVPRLSFNHEIIEFLSSRINQFLHVPTGKMLEQKISENIEEILLAMIKEFNFFYSSVYLRDAHKHTFPLNKNIIEKIIAIEYKAHQGNTGLLFRGSRLVSTPIGGGKIAKVVGQTIHTSKTPISTTQNVIPTSSSMQAFANRRNRFLNKRYILPKEIEKIKNESANIPVSNPVLDSSKKDVPVIDPVLDSSKKYDSLIEAILKNYKKNPFSISFGSSLFAGYINNQGGCAYSYLVAKNTDDKEDSFAGFVLFINKKDQYEHGSSRLFFIPPLSYMSALFEHGYLFHPRATAAIQSKENSLQKVVGASGISFKDPFGFFIVTRDPFKHAVLFSDFIENNSQLIYLNEPENFQDYSNTLLQAQGQSTKFYKALNTIKKRAS